MALGFTFSSLEECRMAVAKIFALRFMAKYGKGEKPMYRNFAKSIVVKESLEWKTIDGVRGYKFKVVNGELNCINAKSEERVGERTNKFGCRYFSLLQQDDNGAKKSLSSLKLAYCLKYGKSVEDPEIKTKRFCGSIDDPAIKIPKYKQGK